MKRPTFLNPSIAALTSVALAGAASLIPALGLASETERMSIYKTVHGSENPQSVPLGAKLKAFATAHQFSRERISEELDALGLDWAEIEVVSREVANLQGIHHAMKLESYADLSELCQESVSSDISDAEVAARAMEINDSEMTALDRYYGAVLDSISPESLSLLVGHLDERYAPGVSVGTLDVATLENQNPGVVAELLRQICDGGDDQ